jgi:outer membrane protein OmpA-like peptidoglycan-associated protein
MRFLVRGLLWGVLAIGGWAQTTVVVYPPAPPPPPVMMAVQARPITYLIAFKDSVVDLADWYWVRDATLYYITLDHQCRTAPLGRVDRPLSARLNSEQGVEFSLPASEGAQADRRVHLEGQLAAVLETRASPRGLIVNISDVLFDFNQYTLTAGAREKLAKVAGILLAYGSLSSRLEGYTDNIGDDPYNLRLSRMRAEAVKDYLVSQGVPAASLIAVGFGSADPVASNSTATGRQQNRRVELVIPGDLAGIGTR